MRYYWIRFADRANGCIDAADETEALELAANHGKEPEIIGTLPYPGEPRLERRTRCPSFCMHPDQCVGRSSCPRLTRSCSS